MNPIVNGILILLAIIFAVWVISIIGGYIIKFAVGLAAIVIVYLLIKHYMNSKEGGNEKKSQ